ncbi:hypothetical protein U876_18850 [Aeromonas hydrophila NJ-35]|nr:hypothetical protein V428_05120 [Aeromonas hydrophila subsp. hydrophila AL09-71]AHX68278.1 hypothetical protein V429_05125 [Aeromonas hydrophila pc104A]AJE38664.1 hypothetical protein V469_18230 [Aeromonas hydrophila J-1]AKJ37096.1 hypothetical protein U876_18850 [Aeromonas hydrophila NJ-35]ALQ64775.1 hypothetical protein AS145_18400 [Aeromonas hydrophila]
MVEWLFTGLILSWFALLTLIGWWVKQALTEAASKEGAKKEKPVTDKSVLKAKSKRSAMTKAFFVVMYGFVALFVLTHFPVRDMTGQMLLTSPVVWWLIAGGVLFSIPRQLARLLLLLPRIFFGVLVWIGTLLLALSKVVLVLLNRMNAHLKEEADYER